MRYLTPPSHCLLTSIRFQGFFKRVSAATFTLEIDLVEVANFRHEDDEDDSRNQDPRVCRILDSISRGEHIALPSDAPDYNEFASLVEHLPPSQMLSSGPPARKKAKVDAEARVSEHYWSCYTDVTSFLREGPESPEPLPARAPAHWSNQTRRNYNRKRRHAEKRAVEREAETLTETHVAESGFYASYLPITTTGSASNRFLTYPTQLLEKAHAAASPDALWEHLRGIRLIPYNGRATRIVDSVGRLVIYRSAISEAMKELLPGFNTQAMQFVKDCQPMEAKDIASNAQDNDWFCVAGIERNNKSTPVRSDWDKENETHLKRHFDKGTPFHTIKCVFPWKHYIHC